MDLTVIVPQDLAFEDLRLMCVGDEIHCEWPAFLKVLRASGYSATRLQDPDFLVAVLVRWYRVHKDAGGDPYPAMEQILAEARGAGPGGVITAPSSSRVLH